LEPGAFKHMSDSHADFNLHNPTVAVTKPHGGAPARARARALAAPATEGDLLFPDAPPADFDVPRLLRAQGAGGAAETTDVTVVLVRGEGGRRSVRRHVARTPVRGASSAVNTAGDGDCNVMWRIVFGLPKGRLPFRKV
jgi:hypothetical protein